MIIGMRQAALQMGAKAFEKVKDAADADEVDVLGRILIEGARWSHLRLLFRMLSSKHNYWVHVMGHLR